MKNVETLNDLVKINNDRVAGYDKAAMQTADEDLRVLFTELSAQSRLYSNELIKFLRIEGDEPTEGTTFSGKIYRAWMDVKASFGGDDRKGLLSSCEFGEDAAQKAYHSALAEKEITGDLRLLIENQKLALKLAHDKVKAMRDLAVA